MLVELAAGALVASVDGVLVAPATGTLGGADPCIADSAGKSEPASIKGADGTMRGAALDGSGS
ncbi:hypothetical protein WME76_44145 (plasmid) [Sorangium sp. So ce119]|uniref:hypothetical protein n=1 Tax=Sorangium sp. So ce119 TaxID=3133279 RepID=UPI003F603D0D